MLRIQDPPEESKQEEVRMTLDGLAQEGVLFITLIRNPPR